MNYTEVEAKVREATSCDPWGPTGQQLQALAQQTFSYEGITYNITSHYQSDMYLPLHHYSFPGSNGHVMETNASR